MKILISLLLISLSSCMVGPNYRQPQIKTPKKFQEAKCQKDLTLKNWWKKFDDPILNELIETALLQNFDVKIAKEKIRQFRAQYRITNADLFPQIDASAAAIRSKISESLVNSNFLGTKYQNFFEVGFDAIWELDFFGKIRREKQAALYAIQAQQEEKNDVELVLTAEIARLYVNIRFYQKKITLFESLQKVEEELSIFNDDLFSSGIDSLLPSENSYSNYQNISAQIPLLHTLLKESFYALTALLGKNPDQLKLSCLKEGPIPSIDENVFSPIPSSLLRRRPDIRRAEKLLAEQTAYIGSAIADLFPKFSLIGNYHQQSSEMNRLFKTPSSSWNIGPTFNWPIITFGKIRANIDQQRSVQRQACLNYQRTIIDAFKDVENAFVAYFDEQKHLDNTSLALEARLKKQLLQSDLFLSGIEDRLQFLEAKKESLDQQNLVLESEKNLSTNLISLYKALGGGF